MSFSSYRVAKPIITTLFTTHDFIKELIVLLEQKSDFSDVAYYNHYGGEEECLTLTFTTSRIIWRFDGPTEVIDGCTKTTITYSSHLLVAEEIAKKLIKDHAINDQIDCYITHRHRSTVSNDSATLQRLVPNLLRLRRLGEQDQLVLNIQCYH